MKKNDKSSWTTQRGRLLLKFDIGFIICKRSFFKKSVFLSFFETWDESRVVGLVVIFSLIYQIFPYRNYWKLCGQFSRICVWTIIFHTHLFSLYHQQTISSLHLCNFVNCWIPWGSPPAVVSCCTQSQSCQLGSLTAKFVSNWRSK